MRGRPGVPGRARRGGPPAGADARDRPGAAGVHRGVRAGPGAGRGLQRPVRPRVRRAARRAPGRGRRPGPGHPGSSWPRPPGCPAVTAAAGPFAEATIAPSWPARPGPSGSLPPMTLAGRSSPGGPVDDITLQSGHWAQRSRPAGAGQQPVQQRADRAAARREDHGHRRARASPMLTVVGIGHLGHQLGGRLGGARRGRPAARAGRAGQRADAVPVPQRGHRRGRPRRRRRGRARPCRPGRCTASAVLPDRQGAGDVAGSGRSCRSWSRSG